MRSCMIARAPLDWNDLRLAVALADRRTLTAAARALAINQSTASRRLASLEESLGVTLFLRGPKGYVATAAGERLLARVRALAEQLENVERTIAMDDSEPRGLVRLAVTEITATQLLESSLSALAEAHPALTVELVVGYTLADISRGQADIAVRLVAPETADLRRSKLGTQRYGLYASKAYLARRGAPRSREDLSGFDVLVGSGDLARSAETQWLGEQRRGARVALFSSSVRILARACGAGMGLAALSSNTASTEPTLLRVCELPEIPARDVWLVAHRDTRKVARVRVVWDAIARDLKARLDPA
jgi:DNA-binding transcriptional LysR family regulator